MKAAKTVTMWIAIPTLVLFIVGVVALKLFPSGSFVNADGSVEYLPLLVLCLLGGLIMGTIGSCFHIFRMRALIVFAWTISLALATSGGLILAAITMDANVPEIAFPAAIVCGVASGILVGVFHAIRHSRKHRRLT